MIRLIAIDIDGTLLDSRGRVPAANIEAIDQAVQRLEDAMVEDPVQIAFNGGVDEMRAIAAHLAVGHNDLDMLRWAGTGVIMGNAEPELFLDGFHLTGTNDQAGLAQAIERFILHSSA